MSLALLTAYRRRPEHLRCQREWLERLREEELDDFEWIVAEGDGEPRGRSATENASWIRYVFVPMVGPFNKAVLLNRAAEETAAAWLCPLDVDLLPAFGTLPLQRSLAQESGRLLLTGFRLNLARMPVIGSPREHTPRWVRDLAEKDEAALGPEESPSALRKYLLRGERFGVCPFYDRRDWRAVQGVDERFVGWGGEDQDLIDRVLALGRVLVRSYDLRYFHMPHDRETDWRDPVLTERNRQLFRARAARRREGEG